MPGENVPSNPGSTATFKYVARAGGKLARVTDERVDAKDPVNFSKNDFRSHTGK